MVSFWWWAQKSSSDIYTLTGIKFQKFSNWNWRSLHGRQCKHSSKLYVQASSSRSIFEARFNRFQLTFYYIHMELALLIRFWDMWILFAVKICAACRCVGIYDDFVKEIQKFWLVSMVRISTVNQREFQSFSLQELGLGPPNKIARVLQAIHFLNYELPDCTLSCRRDWGEKKERMDFVNQLNKKTRNDWARKVVSRRHWECTQLARQQFNDTAQRFHRMRNCVFSLTHEKHYKFFYESPP